MGHLACNLVLLRDICRRVDDSRSDQTAFPQNCLETIPEYLKAAQPGTLVSHHEDGYLASSAQ
jgi:hypothetical protein